mgnify:CR=1 FL=1
MKTKDVEKLGKHCNGCGIPLMGKTTVLADGVLRCERCYEKWMSWKKSQCVAEEVLAEEWYMYISIMRENNLNKNSNERSEV